MVFEHMPVLIPVAGKTPPEAHALFRKAGLRKGTPEEIMVFLQANPELGPIRIVWPKWYGSPNGFEILSSVYGLVSGRVDNKWAYNQVTQIRAGVFILGFKSVRVRTRKKKLAKPKSVRMGLRCDDDALAAIDRS